MKTSLLTFSILLLPGLSAVTPSRAHAQDTTCVVGGVVTDATGLPLPGAVVSIERTAIEATADSDGRFCIAAAPGGPLTLTATLSGFTPQRLQSNRGGSEPATLTFRLAPEFSDQLVVTATRTERRLDDVPIRTELVNREAIERIAARTLADAMEYTTGVRVESNCQNCNFSQIRLLGLEGPYTQILIDGQPVISSLAQVYGIEQLPARMIERLEVVKGGGSALYGPGSVGGVVNVISREPSRSGGAAETRSELVGGVPNYLVNGALDWVDAGRQSYFTAFAQSDRIKPLDVTDDGFTEVSRRNLNAVGARFARYALANRAKLTIDGTRTTEDRRGGNLLRLAPHQADITESIETWRSAGSATWFHTVHKQFDYRATFAISSTDRDSYYGTGGDPNAYGQTRSALTVFDTQFNHYAPRHTVSWGLQGSSETLDDHQPAYDRALAGRYRNLGVFAQDDWTFAEGWQAILGLRIDRHSAVDAAIASPRAALMISPRENLDFRVSLARGFRAPQVFDEDLHLSSVAGAARIIAISPDLREERSTNLMAGVEWKPQAGRGQALVEFNAFHTRLTDLFHVQEADDPSTDHFELLKTNFGGARVYGVEFNAGWGIEDRLIVQGGIVTQRARFDDAEPDFGSREFFRTPRRYGNLTATWNHQPLGELFVGLRFTGSMDAPHYTGYIDEDRLERTPVFTTVDASFSRPLLKQGDRTLVFSVTGRNLTDAFQPDVDQGMFRDSAYVYGPRFPRSVSAGLRVEF
jgi:outer membrane receptor for ferrienterochelin and colicins